MTFIGSEFRKFVKKQIKTRQEALGKDKRNLDNLKSELTNTPWVRLASSVDITEPEETSESFNILNLDLNQEAASNNTINLTNPIPGKSVLKQLKETGLFDDIPFKGSNLAKNFVLFSTVTNKKGNDKYSSLNKESSNSPFGGAYGFGVLNNIQNERGFVPPPGIKNASLSYKNDGALAQAKIEIKAYDRFQFQIIDVLFQRPGYSVLLEFGHTSFLNNEGEPVYAGEGNYSWNTAPFSEFFREFRPPLKPIDFRSIGEKINKTKEDWNGNYDAILGRISKFNWSFNEDGTYDITVNLVGMGDVINALKINVKSKSTKIALEELEASDVVKEDLKDIEEDKEDGEDEDLPPIKSDALNSDLNLELYKIYKEQEENVNLLSEELSSSLPFFGESKPVISGYKTNFFDFEKSGEGIKINGNKNKIFKRSILRIASIEHDEFDDEYDPSVYIKFNLFLALLIKYTNLLDSKGRPLVFFNFNFRDEESEDNENEVFIKTCPGNFSSNPKICLTPYINTLPDEVKNKGETELPDYAISDGLKKFNNFIVEDNIELGRLSEVFLDLHFITKELKNNTDENGDVILIDFLKGILDKINNSLGGLNNFRVIYNQDTNLVEIVSEVPKNEEKEGEEKELSIINTYSLTNKEGSFVKSIDLNAELTDDFATLVSIGSQDGGFNSQGNATAFSIYNKGLVDRIIPEKNSDGSIGEKGEKNKSEREERTVEEILGEEELDKFEDVYKDGHFVSENLNTLSQIQSGLLNLITTKLVKEEKYSLPFFLPFNLGLTLKGLGGMRIYDAFGVDGNVLPPSYNSENIELIIKSLSHDITPKGWETKIETFSKPKTKIKKLTTPNPSNSNNESTNNSSEQDSNCGEKSIINIPPPAVFPLAPKRKTKMRKAFNYVFESYGEVSGLCARYTYNLAKAFTDLFNKSSITQPRNIIPAGGNANQNSNYYNNLVALGYKKTKVGSNISKLQLKNYINNTTWAYGDVIAYYAKDGSGSHRKYGHTQIYVGDITSSGWSTSIKDNYGAPFIYNSRNSDCWDFYVFRSPDLPD